MKTIISLRRISQAIVIFLLLFLSVSHMNLGIEKVASIDAYCPFGAIEGMMTYMTTGEFIKRIYVSTFILMGIVLLVTLLFGRVFCSHFCPLGAIQEWLRIIGRKVGIKKDFELSALIDKYARYIKYVLLIVIIYFSYKAGDLIFRSYDPYNALMHFGEEFEEKKIGYLILGFIVIVSFFSKNLWCRYFCPFGASLAILKKISPFGIRRINSSCVGCGKCNKVCPASLNFKNVNLMKSADCISCLNCVSDCPKGSLKAEIFGMNLKKKHFSLIVFSSFFLILALFLSSNIWQTKAPSNLIDKGGQINVSNLRGSNTLQHVMEVTGIPLSYFIEKLNLPNNIDTSLKLKDIGTIYQIKNSENNVIEMTDFRTIIEEYGK